MHPRIEAAPFASTFECGGQRFGLLATDHGLRQVAWLRPGQTWPDARSHPILERAKAAIREFLVRGKPPVGVPLDLRGIPPFRRVVMETLVERVPAGQLVTYGELALLAGRPNAARAVGTTMSRNPLPLFVPCHRVVAARGPGGFGPGLRVKSQLLALEGVRLPD